MSSDGLIVALIATTTLTLLISLWLHLRSLALLRKHREWAQDVVHDILHTQVDLGRNHDGLENLVGDCCGAIDDIVEGREVQW